MKKISLIVLAVLLIASNAFAFLFDDVEFLTREQVKQLNDTVLEQKLIKTRIDKEAIDRFVLNSGFSKPDDFKKYKALLASLYELEREVEARGKKVEKIDTLISAPLTTKRQSQIISEQPINPASDLLPVNPESGME